jgi:aminopeptidase N
MIRPGLALCLIVISRIAVAAPNPPDPSFDVLHYDFSLRINDDNDTLVGKASITLRMLKPVTEISFDLVGLHSDGKGMVVLEVREGQSTVPFTQRLDAVVLHSGRAAEPGQERTYVIMYKGIPADGLIYGKNKYHHRTIFGDNWPDRARNWLPCVDHPSDKASLDWEITAPDHYRVVANGILVLDTLLADHFRYTHWKEEVPLPTKIMAIGVADFAIDQAGLAEGIPVSAWVYPEDREKGFYDYDQAASILPFYMDRIGPFSYKKLANVQSTTIFGGMENASCIFYAENLISGTHRFERVIAHEIAHQWFGDAVTETDYSHLWLSEGFATYLSALYMASKYGPDTLISMERSDRKDIIAFAKSYGSPVIDTTRQYMRLLNANSYQKGGWVLHMLKQRVGDSAFWKGLRGYYTKYRGANASTQDFEASMELASGQKLDDFFTQWLFTAGHPKLHLTWKYDPAAKVVQLNIRQLQSHPFAFPLDIALHTGARGDTTTRQYAIRDASTTWTIPSDTAPDSIQMDPYTRLLFEED